MLNWVRVCSLNLVTDYIQQGIDLHYRLWLTNGDEDELFFHHFSVDEFCKS